MGINQRFFHFYLVPASIMHQSFLDARVAAAIDDLSTLPKQAGYELKALSENVFSIAQEYYRLSKLQNPSESDLDRLTAILELAQYDSELSCLINTADHIIAHELDLSESPAGLGSENKFIDSTFHSTYSGNYSLNLSLKAGIDYFSPNDELAQTDTLDDTANMSKRESFYPEMRVDVDYFDVSDICMQANKDRLPLMENVFAIAQEYCKLSKLQNPSELVVQRLTAILELAQYDPELSCLINEADHLK
jgi:hypothetical protein